MRPFSEDQVIEALSRNGITHELAVWLAHLDTRVFELERELAAIRRARRAEEQ